MLDTTEAISLFHLAAIELEPERLMGTQVHVHGALREQNLAEAVPI